MKYLLVVITLLLPSCAHEKVEEKKYIETKVCIVNSITSQVTCGHGLLDMGSIKRLKSDEVILLLNKDGSLLVTTFK